MPFAIELLSIKEFFCTVFSVYTVENLLWIAFKTFWSQAWVFFSKTLHDYEFWIYSNFGNLKVIFMNVSRCHKLFFTVQKILRNFILGFLRWNQIPCSFWEQMFDCPYDLRFIPFLCVIYSSRFIVWYFNLMRYKQNNSFFFHKLSLETSQIG